VKPWKTLSRRSLAENLWIKVHEDRIQLPSGEELSSYVTFEVPDWVLVICIDDALNLVLVEQYRHGVGRASLEFPAGNLEPGETPYAAAVRELREETGYASDDWVDLGTLHPEPPRSATRAHLFVARKARQVHARALDQSEQGLRVRRASIGEMLTAVHAGEFTHAVHLGALFVASSRGLITAHTVSDASFG
jgi:8-oxo-dGTP pyrophosphatase MutT (NUDIX family)